MRVCFSIPSIPGSAAYEVKGKGRKGKVEKGRGVEGPLYGS